MQLTFPNAVQPWHELDGRAQGFRFLINLTGPEIDEFLAEAGGEQKSAFNVHFDDDSRVCVVATCDGDVDACRWLSQLLKRYTSLMMFDVYIVCVVYTQLHKPLVADQLDARSPKKQKTASTTATPASVPTAMCRCVKVTRPPVCQFPQDAAVVLPFECVAVNITLCQQHNGHFCASFKKWRCHGCNILFTVEQLSGHGIRKWIKGGNLSENDAVDEFGAGVYSRVLIFWIMVFRLKLIQQDASVGFFRPRPRETKEEDRERKREREHMHDRKRDRESEKQTVKRRHRENENRKQERKLYLMLFFLCLTQQVGRFLSERLITRTTNRFAPT
jgi:hypothetical protein